MEDGLSYILILYLCEAATTINNLAFLFVVAPKFFQFHKAMNPVLP